MAFRNGAYAKVWEVSRVADNYVDVRLSTSRKKKDTSEYEQDFGGFVRFIGTACEPAKTLKNGDKIKLSEVACTQTYNKEQQKQYTNFQCFAFEMADGAPQGKQPAKQEKKDTSFMNIPEDAEDETLPFS